MGILKLVMKHGTLQLPFSHYIVQTDQWVVDVLYYTVAVLWEDTREGNIYRSFMSVLKSRAMQYLCLVDRSLVFLLLVGTFTL